MELLLRISAAYPRLGAAERRIADYVLKEPGLARGLAIHDLAERCSVGQTTVNRFSRTLGYDGYRDFKLDLAAEAPSSPDRDARLFAEEGSAGEVGRIAADVIAGNIHALQDILAGLDGDAIDRAAATLAEARTVGLFASGSSLPVTMDLSYRLMRAGLAVQFSLDSHTQAIFAGLLGPSDAAIAVSWSGESRETLDAIQAAREAGATTLCVTFFDDSSLVKACDIVLLATARKRFDDQEQIRVRVAQLAVCDVLCTVVGRRHAERMREAGDKIDRVLALKQARP